MSRFASLVRAQEGASRRSGFTLIEMMAVIAIIAMIFALGIPRLSSSRWRALRQTAESIADSLEFARQRAVMTGVPHRVLIDLEDGGWRVEWLVSESEALAAVSEDDESVGGSELADSRLDPSKGSSPGRDDSAIDLHPPTGGDRDYHPVSTSRQLGSFTWLDANLYFVGLESASGWVEGGHVQIVFDADGTTEHTLLEIADADDRHMTLEIEPMLDRIRLREGTARS